MMNMKRMIAMNKFYTYMTLVAIGAVVGATSAKMLIGHCCCTNKLKSKAKKALRTMEEKILD